MGLLLVALALLLTLGCKKEAPAQGDVTEVNFWFSYGGTNREVTEAMIADFNASHPKIKIKGTFQGDYFESLAKLRVAARTSSGPVVTHVIGEALPELWEKGLLEDLEPYASGARGSALDKDDFIPALTQDGYFDYLGKDVPLFSLPFNRSTPIAYYNKRMFKEAGLAPPTTWAELRAHSQALTRRQGDQTSVWGFEVPIDWWFWYGMLHQAGGRLLSQDGTQATFAQEPGRRALGTLVDMTLKDKTMKHPPGRDYSAWQVANTDFLNEKVAMIWTSTAFLSYFQKNARFDFGTAFLPGDARRAVPTGGTFFVMMKKAPEAQKAAAWEFMRWMTEPAQTARWSMSTGYMPVRRSALELPQVKAFYEENPDYTTAMDQLKHAVKFPFTPVLLEIQRDLLQPNLEAPVVGRGQPGEVLDKAAQQTHKVLAREKK
jgi:sn-glycerol 3-phosphate transport system substrate-binding protein